ncbi:DNA alkylation repair protein [Aliifodinibius salicampi]|uniref:DNA alkylation repair protein n=1 Tax=Fodinibius salicampi TaxID=1920655 RepID=A0ABT3PTX1_9BACT|nr:DNA alkylation repair protein [Fodinibius salicampi]MCW9711280.1 DNA alkylation repair protein [Fodinibius salicampi]
MNHTEVKKALRELADSEVSEHSKRFFKTGPGEYGEKDQFLGIRVPKIRKIARRSKELSLTEAEQLLHSKFHEERLCALIILVNQSKKADPKELEKIYQLYLSNTAYINNWDLVDTSAEHIMGRYLADKNRAILYTLAKSDDLWERRIAIMSTFHFIKNNDFNDTLKIAKLLLNDKHDLIHKAVGWMLREVGKRKMEVEERFLEQHIEDMPRTMVRYAIEKMPESKRQSYLSR